MTHQPKALVEHFWKDVLVDKSDRSDFVALTWETLPCYVVARTTINSLRDMDNLDSWDSWCAAVIGYRDASGTWRSAANTSSNHFSNCTGVAYKVLQKLDLKTYVNLEASLYVDLADLSRLDSSVTIRDSSFAEIDQAQATAWGLSTTNYA